MRNTQSTEIIWITGAAGYTGRFLAKSIREKAPHAQLIGIGRKEARVAELDQYLAVDLTDPKGISSLANENPPSKVFHLAALMPPRAFSNDMWQVNVGGTLNLLQALDHSAAEATRIVISGSAAEYMKNESGCFDETSPTGGETEYGKTKFAQSATALSFARQSDLSVIIARTFNIIGPNLSPHYVASAICRQYADPSIETLKIGNTRSERDFIDIRDAASAYWALMEKGKPSESYNVCSGFPTSISDLIKTVQTLSGRNLPIETDQSKLRSVDVDRAYGTNDKIIEATRWKPRFSMQESLREMLQETAVLK